MATEFQTSNKRIAYRLGVGDMFRIRGLGDFYYNGYIDEPVIIANTECDLIEACKVDMPMIVIYIKAEQLADMIEKLL